MQRGVCGIKIMSTMALAAALMAASGLASAAQSKPATPIRHVVVIFQENVSFDHYFATYPKAKNPNGEPRFVAAPDTPSVDGLNDYLLQHNPNKYNPQRLDRSHALTCDQDHHYSDEQKAFHGGLMDRFVEHTSGGDCTKKYKNEFYRRGLVMDYFDGNTVTALWNYAQHFAMSDNFFGTTFGPSTPGALNLTAGRTHQVILADGSPAPDIPGLVANGTLISDRDPAFDDCSSGKHRTLGIRGRNIGDSLNAKGITWGWFEGGFRPTRRKADGSAVCGASHENIGGATVTDYIPHHEPFQYYAATANPHHLPPSSVAMIGHQDQANHQYDLSDFWAALAAGDLPAVSFLKAPGYQDGHAGYSDPLDEQTFLVNTINRLQRSAQWRTSAVIIAYDDSDGWYDHVIGPIVNQSSDPANDALLGAGGLCGTAADGAYQDRCGYGPRLPLLVISPWAKVNYVAHNVTDQSSILRFIEDNWTLGRLGDQSFDAKAGSIEDMFDFGHGPKAHKLLLDPKTGTASDHT